MNLLLQTKVNRCWQDVWNIDKVYMKKPEVVPDTDKGGRYGF